MLKVTFNMSESDISKDRHGTVQEAAEKACVKLTDAGYSGEFELEPFRFNGVGKKYRSEYIDYTKFNLKQGSINISIECEYGDIKSISGLSKNT
ncbi:hypothetical protein [Shewanella sp.]|uniref:hypothetical protein n=1 Tax=Shewanella sp. TaxID=50422 RepID=UPI00258842A8|nr:hypothetical protein [Shewanella sp.]MCJ8301693.1 hypothetical protein [Shewanella sp.]